MKTQSKKRMLLRIKKLAHDYKEGKIDKFVIDQSLAGFKGNIKRLTVNGIKVKYIGGLKRLTNNKGDFN